MNILVFGSNGLVGNSLKRALPINFPESEIFFSTRQDTNLFSFDETLHLINNFQPNLIINAAAKVGGIFANNTQRTSFLTENLKINLNILESIMNLDFVKMINLGSSCIYPLNAPNPIKEEYFMTGKLEPTNSPYALAKITGIELGNAIGNEYGHKIINLMPTNLYGPNDNFSSEHSHVIPGLINRMHTAKINSEKKFKIWGSGKPLREFLYIDDLADAIVFIIKNNIEDELINIGSNEEISIMNLAQKLKEIIEFKGDLDFDSNKPDGNPRKLLSSEIINSYGWLPKVKLNTGLNKTYKWYLNNI